MADLILAGETPTLEALWCTHNPSTLTCYACDLPIHPQPLVRTFRLLDPSSLDDGQTATDSLTALGRTILKFDRHLKCASKVRYIAVSHVWNKTVSKVQNGEGDDFEISQARTLAITLPMRVWDGLQSAELGLGLELWHDYLSVPQWQADVKGRILDHVAPIFKQAAFTLVHLEDVSRQCIKKMRTGKTLRARARGVARICNAAWFSRVWTAMEYVRSPATRTMLDDCKLISGVQDVFLAELSASWDAIVVEIGDAHEAEKLMRDHGLVPWQLGPLTRIRSQEDASFAEAFSMLAKRGCRSNADFFHALCGILNPRWETPPDFDRYDDATLAFARECLRKGDYTPILMSPLPVDDNPGGIGMGYHDGGIWSLGTLQRAPAIPRLSLSSAGNPVLKADRIGPVRFLKKFNFRTLHPPVLFSHVAQVALDFTGPNVDDFVATVGTRLYGQDAQEVRQRCMEAERRSFLERALVERFNTQGGQEPWPVKETNRIADALGLSSTALESCGGVPPMRFMKAHGGTLHLGPRGALVGAPCPVCLKSFLFRAALYIRPAEAYGAVAYRIPGLEYTSTMRGGIAILVKNDSVVGRMVWAVPACPCRTEEVVEIHLNPLPERKIHQHRPNGL
ncbi:uncharacterized protein BKCO1_8300034 [Diplodia corticola]|uniref:Heterokaryon incompatibility domain-containing protein n=1 Tax=Diplodia corticola TaxID=236234 RepID=A0A1J9QLM2_9PEZI|nr:uncharacterized protein BKCO1_8300034 [Diplodia corticola]OJD29353.1 hypothetical protein BKCO1_8300034 [Diplodia corticola]